MAQPIQATTPKGATNNNAKPTTAAKADPAQLKALTEKLAYELWEKNGKKPGSEMQNWLEAEKIARTRLGG
jgi:hypothetical protein